MPWGRKKTAAERIKLSERLPQELKQRRAKQANRKTSAVQPADPWDAGDPWLMTEATQPGSSPVPEDPWAGPSEGACADGLALDPWAATPGASCDHCQKKVVEIDLGLALATAQAAAAAQALSPKSLSIPNGPCKLPVLPGNVKQLVPDIAGCQVARRMACQSKLLCNLWLTSGPCHLINKATACGLLTILETCAGQAQSSGGPESSHLVGLHHGRLARSSFVFPACAGCLELVRGPSVR